MSNQSNDIPEGFKMTELGPLPEEWEVAKLGGLADTKAGGTPSTLRSEFWDGDIPWINSGALKDRVITEPTRYITKLGLENSVAKLLPVNSVVIALTGATTGKVGILKFACSTNQSVVGILSNQQFDSVFIFYTLMYSRERIIGLKSGAAQPHINKQIVDNFTISLPPLPEQRAIARMLSTIQKAIEAQDKIIAAARELKKSLMHHLFTYGPVTVAEAEKVPLKETEIGLVPEYWDVVRLGEVIDKPEYGYTASASSEMMGPKFLRITDIQNSGVDWVSVPYCACSPVEEGKYKLQSGDILFARIGATTGKTYLIKDGPPAIFASYLIRVRCKSSLLPDYLGQFTTTDQYWNQINASKGGRLKQGINIPVLKSLLVPFPSLPEQQEIALMLSSVDKKIEAEENRKAALQDLFKTVLHLLMTGRVRVKDLEVKLA